MDSTAPRTGPVVSDCPVCAQLQRCWGGDRVWLARKLLRPAPPEEDVEAFLCRCPECAAIYAFAQRRDGMHLDESLEQLSWLDALALVEPDERAQMLSNREQQLCEWRLQLASGSAWQAHEAARNLADIACEEADWHTVRHLLGHADPAATLAAEMLHRKSRWRAAPDSVLMALATVESRSARWILAASEFLREGILDLQSGDPTRFPAAPCGSRPPRLLAHRRRACGAGALARTPRCAVARGCGGRIEFRRRSARS